MRIFNIKLIFDLIQFNPLLKAELMVWLDLLINTKYNSLTDLKDHFKTITCNEENVLFQFKTENLQILCKFNFQNYKTLIIKASQGKKEIFIPSKKEIKNFDFIESEKTYNKYINRILTLFYEKEESVFFKELVFIELILEEYNNRKNTIEKPHPIDAIKFMMHHSKIDKKKLSLLMQSNSRVSEILMKRRAMSISNIRKINHILKIPIATLSQEYKIIKVGY